MSSTSRNRASYLTVSERYRLAHAVQTVNAAFEGRTYLVGSVTERPDFRDVDLRMILADDDYARWFPSVDGEPHQNPHWKLVNMAISDWLDRVAQMPKPIDFQIQSMTQAGEWDGIRIPLLLGFTAPLNVA